ncbi:MAG: thiamine pyrophosphate-binding protein [Promethearchaeati archaeon SRVP18_Atabeyarchaeia-1]
MVRRQGKKENSSESSNIRGWTGGEIVAEYLIKERVPYIVGIPGHGNLALVDALRDRSDKISVIQVRHEQSAAHIADGYFRASGKPLAVFTSIGPGAANLAIGAATAYVDSTAMVIFTGETHTYSYGRGIFQEIDRQVWADFYGVMRPIVKRTWNISRVDQLPRVLPDAFRWALSGRPGPVHMTLPMDVQAESIETEIPDPVQKRPFGRIRADPERILEAGKLIMKSERPVIVAGGGVILADASKELVSLAEYIGSPVITTLMGKGAIPEDHPLAAYYGGAKGSDIGNKVTREADVIVAVGCRFSDQSTSSYKPGITYSIPPTKLIHIDIDPGEIGKNYPTEIGIVSDARTALADLLVAIIKLAKRREYQTSPYFKELAKGKEDWLAKIKGLQKVVGGKITLSLFLKELRELLDRKTILVGSAGHSQAQLFQEFPVYEPRTHLSSGGFSTMGWCIPAALGAKLAKPDRTVVSIGGDGDFFMCGHELATAVQNEISVIHCLINNQMFGSIRDLQIDKYGKGRDYATEFIDKSGKRYTPDFMKISEAYGCHAERVEKPGELKDALRNSVESGKPSVIEAMVAVEHPYSEGLSSGWWDVPVPEYLHKPRK